MERCGDATYYPIDEDSEFDDNKKAKTFAAMKLFTISLFTAHGKQLHRLSHTNGNKMLQRSETSKKTYLVSNL